MKHTVSTLINSRKLFFGNMLLLLLLSILSLTLFGRSIAFIPSNAYHPFWLNVFFINYTFIGNGLFVICMAAVIMIRFKKMREGTALLYGFIFSDIIIQVLKNINHISQPALFIEQGQYIFSPADISTGSFISGHTTIAFAWITVLVLIIKNPVWQLPLLAAAILLGYSRIYLAQHFLMDIVIAAVTGTISGIAGVYLAYYSKGYQFHFKKLVSIHKNRMIPAGENIQPV